MKKILCFILTIICLLAVAGCGGGTEKAGVPAQKQAVAEKVLRVGTDADYPPFEYYQESSKSFIGFDVELVQGVAREMGYSRVEFVDLEFNNLLPSLKDGQVDAVISCMNITEARKKLADFTEPYLASHNVAVAPFGTTPGGPEAMKDKRIAVEIGSIYAQEAKNYSTNIIECGSGEETLKMIMDKRADYAILDYYTARFYIINIFKDKLAIVADIEDKEMANGLGIAVAKGNAEMLGKLNEGLAKYRTTASFLQLQNTYFGKLK
jgi:polar amino acid transport system substrate-binding protein